jgi:hypothetical protein
LKDDFDFQVEAPATAAATTKDAPAVPEAPSIKMPLFRAGSRVNYLGRTYTVSHIMLSKRQILVYLNGVQTFVPAEKIELELTRFALERT